jgi:hypothetical protein
MKAIDDRLHNNDPENDEPKNSALKHALRRQSAPDGFAERVMLRLEQQRLEEKSSPRSNAIAHDSLLAFLTRPLARWATAGALAAALIAGEIHIQNVRRERAEGEAAKQRLMLALRIAGSKLQLARSRVNRTTTNQNANQVHDQTEN